VQRVALVMQFSNNRYRKEGGRTEEDRREEGACTGMFCMKASMKVSMKEECL
jgi:hypothetical protein